MFKGDWFVNSECTPFETFSKATKSNRFTITLPWIVSEYTAKIMMSQESCQSFAPHFQQLETLSV